MKTKTLHSGLPTPVDHHLRPLMTTSSPSTRAVAAMLVASEDATSGSVMQKALRISARSSGSSHCCLLLLGAVLEQHLHVAGVGRVGVEDQGSEERASHLLGDRGVVDVGQPRAAVGAEVGGVAAGVRLGQEEVPQPLRAGLRLQLLR